MKYETPEVTVLMPAISTIQANKPHGSPLDTRHDENVIGAYEEWEE